MDYTQRDVLQEPRKLPQMLNVLTILTFIGCGLSYLSACYTMITSKNPEKQLQELERQREKLGDNPIVNNMMDSGMEIAKRGYEHRYELLVSALIFTSLCLIGALLMRKLKRNGFWIYTIGELVPVAVSAYYLGFSLIGGVALVFSAVIAVLFVILYATQLKYLR
jgi:hypothetical protein